MLPGVLPALVLGLGALALVVHGFEKPTPQDLVMVDNLTAVADLHVKERCGTIDTSSTHGAGAGYGWCVDAIKNAKDPAGLVGISMGVFNFDSWSEGMSNKYSVRTELYDCFTLQAKTDSYKTNSTMNKVCVGTKEEEKVVGGQSRKFTSMAKLLDGRGPLSTLVKMDVEGGEWDVLNEMTSADHKKIIQFDLELHWCLDSGTKAGNLGRKIIAALSRLRTHYHVIYRVGATKKVGKGFALVTEMAGATPDQLQKGAFKGAGGCHGMAPGNYDMVSISYLNKDVYS